jgi:dienelactone hydrolase
VRFMLVLILALGATLAHAQERIKFANSGVEIAGFLFRPAGSGPFPAVVGLHGCSGLGTPNGAIRIIYRDWGERLAAAGYLVLFPDSFSSRGAGAQCQIREGRITPRRERVSDAIAARRWLQAQPDVSPDRVSLVGWSHGGSTTLWTARASLKPSDGGPDFRSAVAFYPGCRRPGASAWSARVPTLILIGAADDWTPASPCEGMIEGARGRSAKAELVTYPGAYHAFDHPSLPLRERTGLAFTANDNGRAHIGTDQAARADAIKRVAEWLAR